MTATTAARVELLTAEVRVLMVGSRQVTLSVFGQLDRADPRDVEPFGRVRARAHCREPYYGERVSARCPRDCLDVVGREFTTDRLVRACLPRERCCRDQDADAARLRYLREWAELPLIVLAGLR
jgi:hypothetical protein